MRPALHIATLTDNVIALAADVLGVGRNHSFTAASRLTQDMACDSLDRQSIAAELDVVFAIAIPDDDVASWCTLDDVADTVTRLTHRSATHA